MFGRAWSAFRGPFAGGYIFCSCMLAFTVVFGSSFPCLLLLRLAFRCPHVQFTEGSSQAQENHPQADLRALKVHGPQVQVHRQVWALVPAWLVPLRALSSRECPWWPLYFLAPFKSDQSRRTGCTARGCKYAKTCCLCYQKV